MDHGASSYRRYLDGDEEAFREIVEEFFDSLVFFINRYVHDSAAAEDIALDVFTYLVVHKHRYHFRVSLKTYLFMLGRSRALDYIKHRSKLTMVELTEAVGADPTAPSPEEQFLADRQKQAVHQALAQLPEDMRLAVHLVYFEQLSADEAARVLKKNRKQIYNLLYRAKKELRTILGEDGELYL